jgi:hypothetical protein
VIKFVTKDNPCRRGDLPQADVKVLNPQLNHAVLSFHYYLGWIVRKTGMKGLGSD